MTIPVEIRLKIYHNLLVVPNTLPLNYYPSKYATLPEVIECPFERYEHMIREMRRQKPSVAILRLCRKVYQEAIPILYGANCFVVDGTHDKPKLELSGQELSMVKHLRLNILCHDYDRECPSGSVKYLTEACPSLTSLRLHVAVSRVWDGTWDTVWGAPPREFTDCTKLKTAISAVKVCDKVVFEIWDFSDIHASTYAKLRHGFAAEDHWIQGRSAQVRNFGVATYYRSWVLQWCDVTFSKPVILLSH